MTDLHQQSAWLGKITAYTEILVKDPQSTIFVSLAETYRKLGLFTDARRILEKGLQLHPDFCPAHIVLARALCQLEDFPGSEKAFLTALELDPESLAALVGYARLKILLEQKSAARQLLLRARALSPADPVINKLLLSLPHEEVPVAEVQDQEEDEAPLEEQNEGEASPLLVSSTLAELYLQQGFADEALEIYRQLAGRNPHDSELREKIRELEATTEISRESDKNPDQVADNLAEDIPTQENQILDQSTASDSGEESLPSEAAVEQDSTSMVLNTLNQWLENIQRRRGHV